MVYGQIDLLFVEGIAAVVSAVLIFIGSVFLLLALVMGARLAYFVTAAVTLGFVLIMTLVWSYGTPLGPVGQLPEWEPVALVEDPEDAQFGPAGSYPEGDWRVASDENPEDITKAGELESAAIDFLDSVIVGDLPREERATEGEIPATEENVILDDEGPEFLAGTDAAVSTDSTRLLTQGGVEYGALTLEVSGSALEEAELADPEQIGTQVTPPQAGSFVLMRYDPGNPLGKARIIAGGIFLLWVLHLFGLSRAEKKVRQDYERPES